MPALNADKTFYFQSFFVFQPQQLKLGERRLPTKFDFKNVLASTNYIFSTQFRGLDKGLWPCLFKYHSVYCVNNDESFQASQLNAVWVLSTLGVGFLRDSILVLVSQAIFYIGTPCYAPPLRVPARKHCESLQTNQRNG